MNVTVVLSNGVLFHESPKRDQGSLVARWSRTQSIVIEHGAEVGAMSFRARHGGGSG